MLAQYGFIGMLLVIAVGLPVVGLALAWAIRPKKPNAIKNSTYECGIETIGDTWVQFKAQYYLFPWAVAFNALGLYALVEMVLFIAVLFAGLLYAWRKGALEWQ